MACTSAGGSARGGQTGPSFYRYKIGDFEITQIADGARTFPMPDGFVKNVSRDSALTAAEAAYMPKGQVTVPYNPMVVNTGSKLVLIDTGLGSGVGPTVGLLQANLSAAGIDPKTIDIVILSHLHPDHINGLKTADGGLAFPNAETKVPQIDWTFWMSDENLSKATEGLMKDYFQQVRKIFAGLADKVTKYEWGREVAPGITSIDTNGHTPGHTSFVVASGSGRLLIQSDVTNIPELFLRNPDWHVMFDVDPIKAAETRHKFYDITAAEKALIAGFTLRSPHSGMWRRKAWVIDWYRLRGTRCSNSGGSRALAPPRPGPGATEWSGSPGIQRQLKIGDAARRPAVLGAAHAPHRSCGVSSSGRIRWLQNGVPRKPS